MNNLLKFIGKYSNFLVFLGLEVVAFLLIGNFNDYPHSKFLSTSNAIAGWQYEKVTNIKNFFSLRSINEALVAENAQLRSRLEAERMKGGEAERLIGGEGPLYTPAKVVAMTLYEERNYLTLNRGEVDSVREGQGVCNAQGAVGIVCAVNTHYSIVLPLIHTESKISCRFVKNDYLGTLTWDGTNPDYAYLEDVAAHIDVQAGDTIITSGLTTSFPEGIAVGVVDKAELKTGNSYYTIRVHLATDFRKIKYVNIIRTLDNTLTDDME